MIINVCCPGSLDMHDSYGIVSAYLTRELARLGHYTNVSVLRETDYGALPPEIANAATRVYRPAEATFFIGYPTKYALHGPEAKTGPQIALTMFESSRIPAEWVPILNELDAVIVPSRFLVSAFRDSGVHVPVHVVPLGLGDSYLTADLGLSRTPDGAGDETADAESQSQQFSPFSSGPQSAVVAAGHRVRSHGPRPFTFITDTHRGNRKGWQEAQTAFLMAFGDDTNYRLILKARKPKTQVIFTNPNIEAIQKDMTEQELYALYLQCDVMISPNKGEGFGLLPREFAATGGIALATNWGGTADDIDEWGWPIPYTLEQATWPGTKFEGQDLGEWARCDPRQLAELLRHVADNREWYRQEAMRKAERARRYTWRRFALDALYELGRIERDADRRRLQVA